MSDRPSETPRPATQAARIAGTAAAVLARIRPPAAPAQTEGTQTNAR